MARPLRMQFPGGVYHVTARGNEQRLIFADDVDCHGFLRVLAAAVERYHIVCHAYCLMNNHYHLLLETPDANLSSAIRQLNGVYSQRFNRRHSRTGHLFGGRFHAVVIERDAHLREVARYIVLNPVRAGLVAEPGGWRWSSYRATVGEVAAPAFLITDWVLALSGVEGRMEAQNAYAAFIRAGLEGTGEAPELTPSGPSMPGTHSNVGMSACRSDGLKSREFPRTQRFAGRPPLSEVFSEVSTLLDRNARCALAVRSFGYSLREVADFLALHYATVSRALAQHDNLGHKMS
jgi:putative transposase